MTRQRARTLLLLLVLSLLLAPWIHSQIKPYRMRVDMTYYHEISTPIYVYHSNNRKAATDFKDTQVEDMHITENQETPAPLALVRGIVRSTKPISGLRIDPATTPNQIQLGSISVHTLSGAYLLTAEQLEPMVRAGNDIVELDMLYLAVVPGREGHVLNQDLLLERPDHLTRLAPDDGGWSQVIRVLEPARWREASSIVLNVDSLGQHAFCHWRRDG